MPGTSSKEVAVKEHTENEHIIKVENLTKVYGSTNPLNVVKATFQGLSSLLTKEECERLRGVPL